MVTILSTSLVVAILSYTVSATLWNRQFTYHFGPTIRRQTQPREYWFVVLLFLAATALAWAMVLGQTFGFWMAR